MSIPAGSVPETRAMSLKRTIGVLALLLSVLLSSHELPAVELLGPAPVSVPVCMALRSDDICGFPRLAVADFNADGHEDLAINYDYETRLYIMLGDGLGGFTRASSMEGSFSGVFAAADFNRDGFSDLAVDRSPGLFVLLGDGSGEFPSSIDVLPDSYTGAIRAADLNGDGAPDLAVLRSGFSQAPSSVTILLGDGSGGYPSSSDIPLSFVPTVLTTDDFNLDGHQDLAVGGEEGSDFVLRLLLGDGTGAFGPPLGQSLGYRPSSILGADFNGDQATDLAVSGSGLLSVLLSHGDGSFTPADFPLPDRPGSMLADDFDGDARIDIALNLGAGISILFGDGAGGFAGSDGFDPLTSISAFSLASGDFNSDGARDLGLAESHFGTLEVLLGDGIGGFLVSTDLSADQGARSAVVSDLDADGSPDLALASWTTDTVVLFHGDGSGSFARSTVAVGDGPMAIAVGDLNADQAQDLAVANTIGDTVTTLLGDGQGGFSRLQDLPVERPDSIIIEDFNNDARADLAVGRLDSTVGIFLGSGSGSFSHLAHIPVTGQPVSFARADFNHDGNADLAVGFSEDDGRSLVLLGDGLGGFSSVDIPAGPCSVQTSDFNLDGHTDIAIHSFGYAEIVLGDGLGGFTQSARLRVFTGAGDPDSPEFCLAAAVGDFNRDGFPDLAVADGPSTVTVLPGDGLGGLSLTSSLQVGSELSALGVADFNGDSSPDLAAINGNARVLFNQLDARIDLNGSNRVDGFDVGTLSRRFGCGRFDACYDRSADVNLDGLIDGDDLALFASSRFGSLVRTTSPLQALLAPPSPSGGANTATLRQTASEGDLLTVDMILDSTEPLAAANLALTFEPNVLTFLSASAGDYFAGAGVRQAMGATGSTPGIVEISLTRLVQGQPADTLLSGPENLLTLLFKARRAGASPLLFAPFELPQPTLLNASGQAIAQIGFQAGATVMVDAPQGKPGGPRLGLAPQTLDFGTLGPGGVARRKLKISNFGFSDLKVQDVTITSPDFDSFFTEAFPIPAFGYVELTVLFSAARDGIHEAELVVSSDDPSRPSAQVRLIGQGTGF